MPKRESRAFATRSPPRRGCRSQAATGAAGSRALHGALPGSGRRCQAAAAGRPRSRCAWSVRAARAARLRRLADLAVGDSVADADVHRVGSSGEPATISTTNENDCQFCPGSPSPRPPSERAGDRARGRCRLRVRNSGGIMQRWRDRLAPRHLPCERRQMVQGTGIDPALEGDHVVQRVPEIDPAPVVELGLLGQVQAQVGFLAGDLQQEPDLLLADADRRS